MSLLGAILFWGGLAAIASTYVIYPLCVVLVSRILGPEPEPAEITPDVTLIVSAFNEAEVIRGKLENALALDYPADRLQILVISDASDDGTDEIVQEFRDPRVVLCRQEPRGGKSRGITRFMESARGEAVVFSDANSMYEPQALRWLVKHLSDPRVGYVVGYQGYDAAAETNVADSENTYWQYEVAIKQAESRICSVVGGDGAIYAIRKSLWVPLADDDISDFVLPLRIIAQGYRGVFERRAKCTEETASSFAGEFRRKVRIVNRSFTGLMRVPQTLNPFRVGTFSFLLFFHKVVRWFVPFLLVAVVVGNVLLLVTSGSPIYWIALGGQMACYALAGLGTIPALERFKPFYIPYFFCLVNIACARGILQSIRGQRTVLWKPERGPEVAADSPPGS